MAVIDGIIMKNRCVIIPEILKTGTRPTPHQSHGNRKNRTPGMQINILG